jgi:hypothetical protein
MVFMFYVGGLHVLCIVLILIIHPYNGKHDVGRGNHDCLWWNLRLVNLESCTKMSEVQW